MFAPSKRQGLGPSMGIMQGQQQQMPPWEQVQQKLPRQLMQRFPGMMQKAQDVWNSPQGQNVWNKRMQQMPWGQQFMNKFPGMMQQNRGAMGPFMGQNPYIMY